MLRGLGKPVGRFVSSPAVCRASALRRGVRTRSRRAAVVHAGDWRSEAAEVAAERAATPSKAATAGRGFKPFGAPRRAPLSIVPYPSPVLRAANKDVTVFDAALNLLTRDMFAIMYKTDGVGLAAPQVGVNVRLMVFNEAGTPDDGAETVLCNPRLVEASPEEELFEEGCLSFPNIYADVMVRLGNAGAAHQRPVMNNTTQIYANPSTHVRRRHNEGCAPRRRRERVAMFSALTHSRRDHWRSRSPSRM